MHKIQPNKAQMSILHTTTAYRSYVKDAQKAQVSIFHTTMAYCGYVKGVQKDTGKCLTHNHGLP